MHPLEALGGQTPLELRERQLGDEDLGPHPHADERAVDLRVADVLGAHQAHLVAHRQRDPAGLARPHPRAGALDGEGQSRRVDGLAHVVHRALVEGVRRVLRVRGREDDRDAAVGGELGDVHPAQPRHAHVEHGEVDLARIERGERLLARRRLGHDLHVADGLEQAPEPPPRHLLVVRDERPQGHAGSRGAVIVVRVRPSTASICMRPSRP